MSQNCAIMEFSNGELLTQFLKNCGKIPADKKEFTLEDLNRFPFTRWEKFMLKNLLEMNASAYESPSFEKIDLKMVISEGWYKSVHTRDEVENYYICKEFPYLVFTADPKNLDEKSFLETEKGSHNEYIITNDPYLEGYTTYEIAAKMFLPRNVDPDLVDVSPDYNDEDPELVPAPVNDTLVFKDGNPFNWMLENLIWASEANEKYPVIMANKLAIGKYGKFDFGKKYFFDMDEEKIFYIKNFMKVYPTINQNGACRTINLKDLKNNFHTISYDKLFSWMKKRADAYKAKMTQKLNL